jgi:glycosyltransferase involved in cell wall biosynthesis
MPLPFRLAITGPPRLQALALRRLQTLLPEFTKSDNAALTIELAADVVAEPAEIRIALAAAEAKHVSLALSALTADGKTTVAGMIRMTGTDQMEPWESPIGTAILRALPDLPAGSRALNAFAPAGGVSGYGTASRNLLLGMHGLGVRVALIPEWGDISESAVDPHEKARISSLHALEIPGAPTLFYRPVTNVNGTAFLETYRERRASGPSIAYTMFESDAIPGRWPGALNGFDRVWVPTTYNAETFAAAGVDAAKIRVVPIGIAAHTYDPDGELFALADRRRTTFLSTFEWSERKGADVLLHAWAAAFRSDDDVTLYLRTGKDAASADATITQAFAATGLRREELAPIVLLHEALPDAAYRALFRSVDAFVLTSRGEGFCVPILEAMALGKPVIGTGFGGSADFLSEATGFPIPARIVPIDAAFSRKVPLYRLQRWNDPSVTAAAAAMRAIVDDPEGCAKRAAAAFALAHVTFDRTALAHVAVEALDDAANRRLPTTIGNATIVGPATANDDAGDATRELVRALNAERICVALDDTTSIPAPVDQRAGRRLAAARRRTRVGARISVDNAAVSADVTYLTEWPHEEIPLRDGRFVWTSSRELFERAAALGVPQERLRCLPLGIDLDFWTTDAAESRTPDDPPALLVADDPNWESVIAAFLQRFAQSESATLVIVPGGAIPKEDATIRGRAVEIVRPHARSRNVTVAIAPYLDDPDALARLYGSCDAAFVSGAQSERTGFRLDALGIPRIAIDDAAVGETVRSSGARWRLGREARRTAVARSLSSRTRLNDAAFEVIDAHGPVVANPAPPRVYLAQGNGATLRDVALAKILARHVVDDLASANYVALVDGGIEVPMSWDATLIDALEARADAAVVTTSHYEHRHGLFFRAVFVTGQGVMRDTAPAERGIWLTRRGETRTGPLWISYEAAVYPVPPATETVQLA